MEGLAAGVRWLHLASSSLLVGTFAVLLLVARPSAAAGGADALARFADLDRRLVRLAQAALAVALAAGLLELARQLAVATGRPLPESLTGAALANVLAGTRYGAVWLARHGLLAFLGVGLALRGLERDRADWLALRLHGLVLAGASLAVAPAAGHAASAAVAPGIAIALESGHLLAAAAWAGGLLPLLALIAWSRTVPGEGPRASVAAEATRRFSALACVAVVVLLATGGYAAAEQVGSVPALVGTAYGRWLCVKLALLVPLLAVGLFNLAALRPRLAEAATTPGESAGGSIVRRLARLVTLEVALVAAVLAVVAVLGLTTPARHETVSWPFSVRLSWDATRDLPGVRARVAIGSQLATFGLVGALLALVVRGRRWRAFLLAGLAAVWVGLWVALPPLAVDAYPSTYVRPTVPYTAASIVHGRALYRTHCEGCHGPAGYGDGPAAPGLRPPPADLTSRHTAEHTVGDLYWWLTHGKRGTAMPGFGDRVATEERWDLINFTRTLAAGEQARTLGPTVTAARSLVAPDFAYTLGVAPERTLREHRGQRVVLLVFFTLPASIERLERLQEVYHVIRLVGGEIVGVPLDPALDAGPAFYRRLGPRPVFFPIAVEGAEEAAAAYALLRRGPGGPPAGGGGEAAPSHVELLVDRQGYIRGRWIARGPDDREGFGDTPALLAAVQQLAREVAIGPAADDHVH